MTVLLAVMFTPVFQSYKSDSAIKIESLQNDISAIEKLAQTPNQHVDANAVIEVKKAEIKDL